MSMWEDDKRVAAAILHDRPVRRRWLARFVVVDLVFIVVGLWVLDDALRDSWVWFLLWWGGCGLWTLWVLLFAFFDVLLAIKEERR